MPNNQGDSAKPRVLQVITHLAMGGAERVALNLIRGLSDRYVFAVYTPCREAGGDFEYAMRQELVQLRVPHYPGTRVPIKRGGMFFAGGHAAQAVRDFRPALIHLHTEIPESSYAAMVTLWPRWRQIPLVRTIHNTVIWTPWRRLGQWCERRMPRSCVACVSKGAQHAYAEFRAGSGAGNLPQSPVLIHNGVTIPPRRAPAPRLPDAPCRILFAGRLEEQKGADLLPEILSLVSPPKNRIYELTVCGAGSLAAHLRYWAAQPPPGWRITMCGPIPELARRLDEFDLLIMPSRFEGLSLMAIEAALAGLPIVATESPGLSECFPPGYPWLAKPGEAADFGHCLQRFFESPALWAGVAQSAREFAMRMFDPDAMYRDYDKLYRAALSGHG